MRYFSALLMWVVIFCGSDARAQCPPGSQVKPRAVVTDVRCNSGSDGFIAIVVDEGTPPYTYLWSNGATASTLTGLSATTTPYSVTVTDASGCSAVVSNIAVKQPDPFIYNVTIHNVTCFGGSNGSLDFFLSGGTPPYSYVWTNVATNTVIATTEDVSGLSMGIYGLAVTDLNGCRGGIFYLIAEAPSLNVSGVVTNVTCPGGSDGKIILTVTGGTGTKTYQWSSGETSRNLLNKPAGSYTVSVTDVNHCVQVRSFTITDPAPFNASASVTDVTCNGLGNGAIDITPAGGTPPYTFSWSGGQTTEDIASLSAGQYCVTLTDLKNCASTPFCFAVNEPEEITITADITNINCPGESDGAIDITVGGGTPPYTYSWTGGINTEDLSNLSPGLYTVIVTDANGCTKDATFAVRTENILIISLGMTRSLCGQSNGSATVATSGGTPPFNIQWSYNGQSGPTISNLAAGTYGVTVTDANGCSASTFADISEVNDMSIAGIVTNPVCGGSNTGAIDVTVTGGPTPYTFQWSNGVNTEDISGLGAGNYTVTVTDSSGCRAVMTFEVTEESGLTISDSTTPPNCGQSDGSIAVTVTGGTPPYTYSWSNGPATPTISGLSSGIYIVTVTDANGCEETKIIVLQDNAGPQITINKTDITCDNPTGTLEVVITSGTGPFTIVWSTGDSTATISGLEPGIYAVQVTDSAGCSTLDFTLLLPSPGIVMEAEKTEPSCNGFTDGLIDVTVIQGTAPFTYLWSTGANTEDISGIGAGTYSITVTDAGGCSATTSITVDEPEEITATQDSIIQPLCNGDSNGSLFIAVTGGTAPYSYAWSNGDTTEDLTNLPAGQYCVTIADAHDCVSNPFCFTINEPEKITITADITNVTCPGESDGAIDITVGGGTPPYTYSWTGGINTEDLSNLSPGLYTIIVTDGNGCTMDATYAVRTENLLIISIGITQPLCGESNGSATVTVSGGDAPFNIQWSNGQTGTTISNLFAGSYGVTVTDANGCTASEVADISNVNDIIITANVTNTVCGTANTGTIDITVSGGAIPYTYQWSNGANTEDIIGLAEGSYTVTVTDSSGCEEVMTFEVIEESGLTISEATTPPNCGQSDGSIAVTVTGGTPPYTYSWSNGPATPTISGLSSGIYIVTVTDANGCEETKIIVLQDNAGPQITINKTDITCDNPTGTLEVVITSGTGPFTIVWSTGDSTATISGLEPGIYAVQVTDSAGCSTLDFAVLTPAPGVVITAAMTEPSCHGTTDGSIDVTVIQGIAPFTYLWSTGANTEDISGIGAGTYSVTVTDAGGCSATTSITVDQPEEITATQDSIIQPLCNGDSNGSLFIAVTGGTAPYSYAWSNGDTTEDLTNLPAGQYCVTIADAHDCVSNPFCFTINEPEKITITADITNVTCPGESDGAIDITVGGGTPPYTYSWTGGINTEDLSNLSPGLYTIIVTDGNGCTMDATYAVRTENLLIISIGITQPLCGESNGSATVTVSGGDAPFNIQWSNGQTGTTISNLFAGSYGVTVTDANGCTASEVADISNVNDIIITANVTNTVCGTANTGTIDITVSGGAIPYTYQWSNGANTEDIIGLAEGSYTVTVTDSSGCEEVMTFEVIEESGLTISEATTPPNCGQSDGSIAVTVTGGTPPYTYSWSNGPATPTISGLSSGIYIVTVTDANGCEETKIIVLQDNAGPQITINKTDITCDNPTGTLEVVITSGTGPFTIVWSTGDSTATISGLEPGIYAVQVTDSAGCSTLDFAVLTPAPGVVITAAMTEPSCHGTTDGSIDVTVIQGIAPFTYLWSTGANTEDISGIGAGTYSVTVTDAGGCSATTSITVDQPEEITATADTLDQPKCSGDPTGGINITVAGGTAPYSYDWSNGDTTEDLTGIATGQYCVVITDAHGCVSDTFCFFLNEPEPLQISPDITQPTCNGGDDGAIAVNVTGGIPPYSFQWSNGDAGRLSDNLSAGPVSVTVTDANECTAMLTVNIPEPAPFDFSNSQIVNPICDTTSDGLITVIVMGGTSPYNFVWGDGSTENFIDSLAEGDYSVTVTDAHGCTGSDTFTIDGPSCSVPPVAVDDTTKVFVCKGQSVDIPVMNNDYDPDGDDIYVSGIQSQPTSGTVQINSDQTITYTPSTGFTGIDSFKYTICEANREPSLCDAGNVIITVLPCRPNITIPTGVSPNGDGTNDGFVIPGIEFFPDNELLIFNRWGNKVIEFHGYKNEWTGNNGDKEPLPDGTYYFILKLNDDANTTYTGFVVIHR